MLGTIGGVQHSASYGQGDDMYSVASSLASSLNGTTVNASASGDVVYITAARNGSDANYSLSAGSQSNEGMNSFSAAASGASLTAGTNDQIVHNQVVYHLNGVSYAPDGDLLGAADSINGTWGYSFNALNQLTQANCTTTPCSGTALAFSFDRYGNRWASQTGSHTYTAANQVVGWGYDAAGDTTSDGAHTYTFDGEGRIATVSGGGTTASYVYDAEGRRVHETVNGVVKEYVYGAEGQELTVVDGSQNLIAGETYFDGRHLGTQTPGGFVWAHADELGTIRARTNSGGSSVEADTSWPFGAHLNQVGAYSALHYTAKPRDSESGLDYFGARYYNSTAGRFITPDWSTAPEPVPYASLENPQSLNLYDYVLNNPVTATDPDGHICVLGFHLFGAACTAKPKKPVKESGSDDPTGVDPLSQSMLKTAEQESQGAGKLEAAAGAHPIITNIAIAAIPGGLEEEGGVEAAELIKPSAGQIKQAERVLANDGVPAVRRAIKSLEELIESHAQKIESAPGYTSSMEKEVRNFKQLLEAYKSVLGGGQ